MISKILISLLLSLPSQAAIEAVATTTDVAWLLHRIGGAEVNVKTLAKPGDSYHFLDARPDFVLAVSRAQILCLIGADLEMAWLPKIVERSTNQKIKSGAAGDCDLSRAVALQKPSSPVDRSRGDVHSAGNPHFWLSPIEMANAAGEVEKKLAQVLPAKAADFSARKDATVKELNLLASEIKERLKPLAGKKIYEYHQDFSYYLAAYGLSSAGSIEEIPGVAPSAARLGQVGIEAKKLASPLALALEHHPASTLAKFTEISGVPVVKLPPSLENPEDPDSYARWQRLMADRIRNL